MTIRTRRRHSTASLRWVLHSTRALFVAIDRFYGWQINALALLADAEHNLSDVTGLGWRAGLQAAPGCPVHLRLQACVCLGHGHLGHYTDGPLGAAPKQRSRFCDGLVCTGALRNGIGCLRAAVPSKNSGTKPQSTQAQRSHQFGHCLAHHGAAPAWAGVPATARRGWMSWFGQLYKTLLKYRQNKRVDTRTLFFTRPGDV